MDAKERELACGCREVYDATFEAWAVLSLCEKHTNITAKIDQSLPQILDHELDAMVYDAAGGHRVQRIEAEEFHRLSLANSGIEV